MYSYASTRTGITQQITRICFHKSGHFIIAPDNGNNNAKKRNLNFQSVEFFTQVVCLILNTKKNSEYTPLSQNKVASGTNLILMTVAAIVCKHKRLAVTC